MAMSCPPSYALSSVDPPAAAQFEPGHGRDEEVAARELEQHPGVGQRGQVLDGIDVPHRAQVIEAVLLDGPEGEEPVRPAWSAGYEDQRAHATLGGGHQDGVHRTEVVADEADAMAVDAGQRAQGSHRVARG